MIFEVGCQNSIKLQHQESSTHKRNSFSNPFLTAANLQVTPVQSNARSEKNKECKIKLVKFSECKMKVTKFSECKNKECK